MRCDHSHAAGPGRHGLDHAEHEGVVALCAGRDPTAPPMADIHPFNTYGHWVVNVIKQADRISASHVAPLI